MIVLDANLLIYAVNEDAPLHRKAKLWLESVLSGPETVGFPWNDIVAYLLLTTRTGLFRQPLPVDTAFDLVALWLDQTSAIIVHPGPRHLPVVRGLLLPLGDRWKFDIRRASGGTGDRAWSGTLFVRQRLCQVHRSEVAQPSCLNIAPRHCQPSRKNR